MVVSVLAFLFGASPYPEAGKALVSSDHRLASEAGAEVLAAGGNAVDAAVATALAAGVVQPAGSGLGGGGFAVVRIGGANHVLDFREVAPAGASRDMYRNADGGVNNDKSKIGDYAVGIPGEGRGLAKLLADHGTLSPAQVAAPAARLATRGFVVGAHLGKALRRTKHAEVKALFGDAATGSTVTRPALGKTLKKWAATKGESLYTGAGGLAIAGASDLLEPSDLAGYEVVVREPIEIHYRDWTVVTMPPPSSGGVALAEMLRALEGYDLVALGHNSSDYIHLVTEVMKHAYADRAHHLGDPAFTDVPVERLVSDARRDEIRSAVWPGRTFPPEHYGPLIAPPTDGGTQHISVIDAAGNAVALTTTINTSFGSGVVVEELGIVLNNEMDDFSAAPGVPNYFGLVGTEANAVQPGKRPLSSMTPTLLLDPDGNVVMSVGASGGSFIISSTLLVILGIVEFGLDPQEAVASPRFHHQWQPDKLMVERAFARDVTGALTARGHDVMTWRDPQFFSSVQVVYKTEEGLQGGADPRKGGWPAGVR